MSPFLNTVVTVLLVTVLIQPSIGHEMLGKLVCHKNAAGLVPSAKLLKTVTSECQLKIGASDTVFRSCLAKCIVEHIEAIDDRGKLDVGKVKSLIEILPDSIMKEVKTTLDGCINKYAKEIDPMANDCKSYVKLANCFFDTAEKACPKLKLG